MILNGRENPATMKWVWCTLAASLFALLGGLILVLLLSHLFVVPHLKSDDFVQTECYVRNINIVPYGTESESLSSTSPNYSNCSLSFLGPQTSPRTPSLTDGSPGSHLGRRITISGDRIVITQSKPRGVIYRRKEDVGSLITGRGAGGVIAPRPGQEHRRKPTRNSNNNHNFQAIDKKNGKGCSGGVMHEGNLCVQVLVLYRAMDRFVTLGTLFSDPKDIPVGNYTDVRPGPPKCICDGCELSAKAGENGTSLEELRIGGVTLRQGTRTRCYYPVNGGNRLLMSKKSNAVAMHAILWPTLVFVSGFVGLFFSCLIMQKQRQKQRKTQQNTTFV